ncbi:hypothetical protein DCAR_0311404 [Daucus carota subsp. sativus]|uniref:RRM domain-containing protein n=1 Tax=Daucus carota subsp. sativus TaxID=79200 RepID=A0AAF1AQW3_DAUCS|nr:hypothetical protein DCAR_0311404 [Daucus carota subsp. sativus]
MSGDRDCTVFIGNLDERVSDRVLYDILIQAGRVVDLYIPRDRETDRPKGFAFAEYETQEIADYAVRLFSGLVTLYNRTLRFAISGQDKPAFGSAPKVRQYNDSEDITPHSAPHSSYMFSSQRSGYAQVRTPPGVSHEYNRPRSSDRNGYTYNGGRLFGSAFDSTTRSR